MRCSKTVTSVLLALITQFLVLHVSATTIYSSDISKNNKVEQLAEVRWIFDNQTALKRSKRSPPQSYERNKQEKIHNPFDDPLCRGELRRLCGNIDKHNDDLLFLECVQTFKPNEVSSIDDKCQHSIFKYMMNISDNENIKRLAKQVCGDELDNLKCTSTTPGSFLSCLIEKREQVKEFQCSEYIQRWEWVAFSDFRIVTPFVADCQKDIEKFQCGRIQFSKDIAQGEMLACLQQHVDKLEPFCKKRIFYVSEAQADNIKLDRQLYMACAQDQIRFCPQLRAGSGQVFKCLMQHKMHRAMTKSCQHQLTRREKLMASDYKVSKGLVRACKEDIKNYHCRRSVSDDKEIRLAQILLCLESVIRNGSKISQDCQVEMFDHRKILMDDYRLSPEIVDGCAKDISQFCNGLEVGGRTIHCLMEHTRSRKRKLRITAECQRALEALVKEADAGEDWRIDPVLREACQPVVNMACGNVKGGDARVISCLMENLGTSRMTDACETALVQIQYFVARNYKLDPQLYRACRANAVHFCSAKTAWGNDGLQMDPERGPLVLPCLYRYVYHPQKNMTLKKNCLEEIRRVMRQRAMNVDLQPEIEEACLNDLADLCSDKTAKGEEILCLQDNLENLKSQKCRNAVGNLTEEQAERVELNPIITNACSRIIEHYCQDTFKHGRDEGDMMECLIEHKNDLETAIDYKCKAAVEHFQLISLKSYHFTFKFKEACRPLVLRWCQDSKTKADVIECLSSKVQEDVMKDSQPRISKNCRQQLKAQLYQQRENIQFDPVLQKKCAKDIDQLCFNVIPGNSQILECLANQKRNLSDECHKQLFKVRKQEFEDSSSDFALLNICHSMVMQFCHKVDRSQALDCLKRNKDEPTFDDKCKNFVIQRMIEQNTDYRFNTALQSSCSTDIDKHCKEVLRNEPMDKELKGKVIRCLKIKFRESKLTIKCEHQMVNILREAALNYHLNPLLATSCADEIETICRVDENERGAVEECLKEQFNANNKLMREKCRMQVADLIEEATADIHVDPLLQTACAVDVTKYCSDVPEGAGRHILCLQNILQVNKKSLQPNCKEMLTKRIEMFKNAAKLIAPNSIEELFESVNRSPARRYFMIVALSMIGMIFVSGLFCGRFTRRAMMIMKNK